MMIKINSIKKKLNNLRYFNFFRVILLVLFMPLSVNSQINLIPNNSFEDTVNCRVNLSGMYGEQIYALTDWFPAAESPDYLNSCSNNQANVLVEVSVIKMQEVVKLMLDFIQLYRIVPYQIIGSM
ncbi:MAG: hypothetical protein IPO63_05025 [Bacteroidetes bacterium]|nr:hypothetical protein [Bacteroidota bacterium]